MSFQNAIQMKHKMCVEDFEPYVEGQKSIKDFTKFYSATYDYKNSQAIVTYLNDNYEQEELLNNQQLVKVWIDD